jgi:hypothetical protein
MENKFSFDSEKHLYSLDKVHMPGVSEILESVGFSNYSMVNKEICEAAQKFGNAGHTMCKLWDMKILNVAILDLNLVPYLRGYEKFLDTYKPEILSDWIERPSYSPKWRFGFTLDRVAYISKKLTIYDLKFTTTIQEATSIQLAGYKVGFEDVTKLKVIQRWGLQILPDDFKVEPYTDRRDEGAFLNALGTHNEKLRRNLWKVK